MIDINKTVLSTIEDKIKREAYQGITDPNAWNIILQMVILQDLMEWCETLDDSNEVKKLIQDKQALLIANNYDIWTIIKDYCSEEILFYRNVNTPQTRYTWQRVFDKGTITENVEPVQDKLYLGEVITELDYLLKNSCPYGE